MTGLWVSTEEGRHPSTIIPNWLGLTTLTTTIFNISYTLRRLELRSVVDVMQFFTACQDVENIGFPAWPELGYLGIEGELSINPISDPGVYAHLFDTVGESLRHMPEMHHLHVWLTGPELRPYHIWFLKTEAQMDPMAKTHSFSTLRVLRFLLTEENVQPWMRHARVRRGRSHLRVSRRIPITDPRQLEEDSSDDGESSSIIWNGENIEAQENADNGIFPNQEGDGEDLGEDQGENQGEDQGEDQDEELGEDQGDELGEDQGDDQGEGQDQYEDDLDEGHGEDEDDGESGGGDEIEQHPEDSDDSDDEDAGDSY